MPIIRGLIYFICLCFVMAAVAADKLPSFHGDPRDTSVSGFSSGAYMAVQYEVAYSASVRGAGIIAGGPYYCAAGSLLNASVCMGQAANTAPAAPLMVAAAKSFAASRKIDSLDHLRSHRVYVFSGTNDQIVKPPAVDAAVSFYQLLGINGSALKYVNTVPAGHAVITPDYGNECSSNMPPGINHCTINGTGYDQAGAILRHIYGAINPPSKDLKGKIVVFDQNEFASGAAKMADEGYAYVPQSCASGAICKLLIAFHGCQQSAKAVGDKFYVHAGFDPWADTNNVIVLYPQVNASWLNLQGCWDWFGYTGGDYAIKAGPQLAAVKAMADRLLGQY